MIKTVNLTAAYDAAAQVLKDVNLQFDAGSMTALLGPNGAGKTTLLKCLCGYIEPLSGKVLYNSKVISEYSRRDLAREIALVPQKTVLQFDYQVRELVLMGRFPYLNYLGAYSKDDHQIVNDLLDQLDLTRFADKNFGELSGGEQQLVIIARALAQKTPLLLLDEAFTGLDVNHSMQIMGILKRINSELNKTIIMVSHNINLAVEFCSDAVIMKKGEVFAEGKVKSIITEEVLSNVYEHNLKVITNPESGLPNMIYTP